MAQEGPSSFMTREELLELPPAIDLETANRALRLSRSKGYDLARRGAYPCKLLRIDATYRVVTADLHRILGVLPPEDGRDRE